VPSETTPLRESLRDSLVAQAAAVVTVIGGGLWVVGALLLGLTLAFRHLPVNAVLTQFPQGIVVVAGVTGVAIPAVLVGALLASLVTHLVTRGQAQNEHRDRSGSSRFTRLGEPWLSAVAVVGVAILCAVIPGLIVGGLRRGVTSFAFVAEVSFAVNIVIFGSSLWAVRAVVRRTGIKSAGPITRGFALAVPLIIVLVPIIAELQAAQQLTDVEICRMSDGSYVPLGDAGLLVSSSTNAYVLQFTPPEGQPITGRYLLAIPPSAVRVGEPLGCLAAP
jgi:hypothetical protein